jgi:LPXTG-site transpeptidase (sortase) family protein
VYDEYIVMPELGIVSPVIYTPSTDPRYKDIVEGRNLDVNEFLKQGVHHYPGTSLPGFEGNALIGWHSNFFKNQATDFTSIFHNLPMLDSGDVVWYYKRATPESWMRYVYIVTQSYETKSDDARVFDPIGSGVEMTFYTCVPIGTADNRWIVRTQLESSQQVFYPQTIESYDNFVWYQDLDEATQAQLRALIESGASDDEIQALITSWLAQQKTSGDIADVPEATVVASLPWWKQLRQWFVRLLSSSF